ncbi:MAG TPA: AmmeMemoRadiSam system radical SAM enzyme [Spirochaetia bacterium]|nr:AmmeMemoRadiSam system radical SAM enzyme [Spirochaetia bacterium]
MGEAAFWEATEDGKVACLLCPRRCILGPGQAGACKVRRNEAGRMVLPFYGALSSLAVDPIEKKPLHHFLPGSQVFSVGFLGCNLRCPFCQNWEISQELDRPFRPMSPAELVDAARRSGCPSLAYTYSEPIVHAEYLLEAMDLARGSGLRNVLVTNGCASEAVAVELLARTDAVNVDLKCWSAEDYGRILGGKLEAVASFIRRAAELPSCLVEVTTLVVPGLSDSAEGLRGIARFLAGLSPDIPLHLSAYHPAYRFKAPATSPGLLRSLAAEAKGLLRYVYIGNLTGEGADSACPSCGALLVRRRGYATELLGLEPGPGGGPPRCSSCSASLPFVLEAAGRSPRGSA